MYKIFPFRQHAFRQYFVYFIGEPESQLKSSPKYRVKVLCLFFQHFSFCLDVNNKLNRIRDFLFSCVSLWCGSGKMVLTQIYIKSQLLARIKFICYQQQKKMDRKKTFSFFLDYLQCWSFRFSPLHNALYHL